MKAIINKIVNEIDGVLEHIVEEEVKILSNEINKSKRIFVAGQGRSGLIGKVFAMRLMQSGYPVFVVGETITPNIEKNDLLLIISGSGNTTSLVHYAEKVKEIDAKLIIISANKNSQIGNLSHSIVYIPAVTKERKVKTPNTIQPLGSQFDQSAHILLDALIVYMLDTKSKEQVNESLNKRHTNLE